MTKAEQKKAETEARYDFIKKTYATVLECIPETTRGVRTTVQIRLDHKSSNRYIHFHKYGGDLNVLIYGDGNVAIEVKEIFHSDFKAQVFGYPEDNDRQQVFWQELKELLSDLIEIFVEHSFVDWHTYMDYVSVKQDLKAAYELVKADFCRE
ncbi:MAG: hypothetical protein LUH07_13065 [Lachnospiraceae bacterium]|nr:hypothetical protein [Lachnospiraceae bacterium]